MATTDKSYSYLTLDLPLDLVLKCYEICIKERITFEEFVRRAIKSELKKYNKNGKLKKS